MVKSIPGIEYIYEFNQRTGGSCNARYCYSVWLRHLIISYERGLNSIPKIVAELGPGDSLGAGIAALISGAEKYYPLDIKKYSNEHANLKMLEELVGLFTKKSDIPDDIEFPELRPLLKSYKFPDHIFTKSYLAEILDGSRLSEIEKAIRSMNESKPYNKMIYYQVPWDRFKHIEDGTIDMIFSQAVLQDVHNLDYVYKKIWELLKPNGFHSHDIGFKSCGTADSWFGHWLYTDREWKIVRGRMKQYINREPYSTHRKLLLDNKFKIVEEQKRFAKSTLDKQKLPVRFKTMENEDLITYSVFVQAIKISDV
jgi:hypothetical protein